MIHTFTFNHFEVNCYLLFDEVSRQCAIVDPAAETSGENHLLEQFVAEHNLRVEHILLTHAHVDHIAGLRHACRHYGLPVTMHPDGRSLLRQAEAWGSMMGFAVDDMSDLAVREIGDDDVLQVGSLQVECRCVPGHCPGSMCFVVPQEEAVLTGDALFHYSIGRTDLPGGDYPTLISKLKTRILTLPDNYRVLAGHGIESQIGKERRYNSFLQ